MAIEAANDHVVVVAEPASRVDQAPQPWRRRSDRAAAVARFLVDPEHHGLSDRGVARQCGVSHQLVARVRAKVVRSEAPATRTARRRGTTYEMEAHRINAERVGAWAERQTGAAAAAMVEAKRVAAELRRAQVDAAFARVRERLAVVGTATPAGAAYLAAHQRTRWLELGELDARLRLTREAFVRGAAGAGQVFEAALVAYEYAWRDALSILRNHRPPREAPNRCSRCGVAGAFGCVPGGNGVVCASCRGVAW